MELSDKLLDLLGKENISIGEAREALRKAERELEYSPFVVRIEDHKKSSAAVHSQYTAAADTTEDSSRRSRAFSRGFRCTGSARLLDAFQKCFVIGRKQGRVRESHCSDQSCDTSETWIFTSLRGFVPYYTQSVRKRQGIIKKI